MTLVKAFVENLAKEFQTRNPVEICRALKIPISILPLGSLNGTCSTQFGMRVSQINSALDDFHRRLACAHELGHIILRHRNNKFFLSQNTNLYLPKFEKEADCFAIELLLPDKDILDMGESSCDKLAEIYNIPPKLAEYKTVGMREQLKIWEE